MMYSFIRAIIESLRTDSLMLGPLRVSQILSVVIFIFALVMYVKNTYKKMSKNHEK